MKVFKSMIFFGITLLIAGVFFSWITFGFSEMCESDIRENGVRSPNQCTQIDPPWNLIGIYLLPGIILISSSIFLKKKNR